MSVSFPPAAPGPRKCRVHSRRSINVCGIQRINRQEGRGASGGTLRAHVKYLSRKGQTSLQGMVSISPPLPQFTEGEKRPRREVTHPKSYSGRGLSDTYLRPSHPEPFSSTPRMKCRLPRPACEAPPVLAPEASRALLAPHACGFPSPRLCLCGAFRLQLCPWLPPAELQDFPPPRAPPSIQPGRPGAGGVGGFQCPGAQGASLPAPSPPGSPSHCLASVPPDIPTMPRCCPAPPSPRRWGRPSGRRAALTSGRPHLPLSAYGDSPAA